MRLQQHFNPVEDIDDPALIEWQIANAPILPEYEENDEEAIARCQEIEAANQPVITPEDYEAIMAADDFVDDVIIRASNSARELSPDHYHTPSKDSGRLFNFEPVQLGVRRDYEYVVDGLLRYGCNALSGPRGFGKSSLITPLSAAIAGLKPDYPMDISIRRRVIVFTEDVEQMSRIFESMINDGYMDVTQAELNRWVHLVPAERMKPKDVADHASELAKMWTPNERVDGSIHPAGPLAIFDTISAGLELDSISDNDEISREISNMRKALDGKAALLLVGHTAKDGGKTGQTMLGAQAWEANTIGSITLKAHGNGRAVEITKDRFAAPVKMFEVTPIRTSYQGLGVLGRHTTIHDLYSELRPMTKEQEEEVKEAEKAAQVEHKLKEDTDALLAKLTEMLNQRNPDGSLAHPDGVTKGELYKALPRKETVYRPIIKALKDKKIEVNEEGSADLITIKTDTEVV